tara:strand:- start:146 stop:802 length:657 start_codon:yes stop_codon:yes gene_type:complete
MNKYKGMFISFEGGEASGKTTQINKIKRWLKKNKYPFVATREPGGTKISETLRRIILSSKENIDVDIEVLLLMASRIDHLNKIIYPALKKGKIIICDRFVDSTAVYQGYYRNFGINNVYNLHKIFLNNTLPDLTFFFKIHPKIIKSRLNKRKVKNKYDLTNFNFNNIINNCYLKIAKNNKRFTILDGSLPKDEISKIIIKSINKKISNYGIRVTKKNK